MMFSLFDGVVDKLTAMKVVQLKRNAIFF